MDKSADMLIMINAGKILFEEEKDFLLEKFRVVKGDVKYLSPDIKSLMLHFEKSKYGFTGISDNASKIKSLYPDVLLEKASIEDIIDRETNRPCSVKVIIDEYTYNTLVKRYQELHSDTGAGNNEDDAPYDLDGYITTIDTDKIDSDYMNSRFVKYIKTSRQENISEEEKQQARNELHKTFANLSQEEQKVANILLHEMQREDFVYEEGKTFREYISDYLFRKHDARIHILASVFGLDEKMLHSMMNLHLTTQNINEFGRYDALKNTIDKQKAKLYFESLEGKRLIPPKVSVKADNLLREFIISGGFDIQKPETYD